MNLYSIQKGKYVSNGIKEQPIFYQIFCLVVGIALSVIFSSMTLGFITLLAFLFFSITISGNMETQSTRVYFLPQCASLEPSTNSNTIYGIAHGYTKWNSASLGWKSVGNGTIEIVANCYINGKFIEKPMLRCKPQSWIFLHIENKRKKFIFKAMTHNGKSAIGSIQKGKFMSIYTLFNIFIYKLYPKIGGKKPAPFEIKIYMKKLATTE